jgi:membrane-bound lytic murein transglycosylase A
MKRLKAVQINWKTAVLAASVVGLSACSGRIIPPSTQRPAPASRPSSAQVVRPQAAVPVKPAEVAVSSGPNALTLGAVAAPPFATSPFDAVSSRRALAAFRISCPTLVKRKDQSGLTFGSDWKPACDAAAGYNDNNAASFFSDYFELAQIGDGKAFATGYYEPEIRGSRTQSEAYNVPVYKRPTELAEVDLGQFSESLKGKKIRGKVSGGTFVPFEDRSAIEEGALGGRGLELAYAADAAEFFFLQVQGSGRLKLPDGAVMRIGYDGQNGRDYTGIGKLMKDRGLLAPGQSTMQGIVQYLHDHPEEGKAIMRENKSWVFFKEVTGAGPLGALGLPVTARGSVATDPQYVPLGAPVLLSMDRVDASGLWIAQDTGGAIKGSNRFDTFWGAGAAAAQTAGGMAARGTAFVLLPKGVLQRLSSAPAP